MGVESEIFLPLSSKHIDKKFHYHSQVKIEMLLCEVSEFKYSASSSVHIPCYSDFLYLHIILP